MSDSITKTISSKEQVNKALNWLDTTICKGLEGGPVSITLGRPDEKRTLPQNSKTHAIYYDLKTQAVIVMPGRRIVLNDYTEAEVKALAVVWFANERELEGRPLRKPPRTVLCPITGQNITVRPSTAEDFGKKDTAEFIEFLHALGADTGVIWGDPATAAFSEYREAQS